MKITLLFVLTFFSVAKAEIIGVLDLKNNRNVNYIEFLLKARESRFIVLGEFHYNSPIQKAEGQLIEDITNLSSKKEIAVMWEFLNYTDQDSIDSNFQLVKQSRLTAIDFLKNVAGDQNVTYSPIVEAAKNVDGGFYGLNLPRVYKQKVINEGIQSIDSKLIPANHYVGGDNYLERFKDSMGGHVNEDKLQRYFVAQCLTDSVMSTIAYEKQKDLNFIIAGSFHTDFFDGTVVRLNKLIKDESLSLKIVNVSDLSEDELKDLKNGDTRYGTYADFLILTRE